PVVPQRSAQDRLTEWIDLGRKQFTTRCRERNIILPEKLGTIEGAFIIDGKFKSMRANEQFLSTLFSAMPHLSGWSPWLDSRYAKDKNDRTYVIDNGWEALLHDDSTSFLGPHLDFWRMEPEGRFYHLRGFEDDMASKRSSGAPEPV